MFNEKVIQEIAGLAMKAEGVRVIDVGDNQKAIVYGGKIIEKFTNNEAFGQLKVTDFGSFLSACERLIPKAETPVIKVGRDGILLSCDANKPHKFAQVCLNYSLTAAYECLVGWEQAAKGVPAINKMLRTKLFGTFDEKLIAIFKQIEFARQTAATIQKTAHRDTMGRAVDNAVKSSAGDLPEVITFSTRLWQNVPSEVVQLRYYVDVNHDAETIGIAATGDVVNEAIRDTIAALVDRLAGDFSAALVVAS